MPQSSITGKEMGAGGSLNNAGGEMIHGVSVGVGNPCQHAHVSCGEATVKKPRSEALRT